MVRMALVRLYWSGGTTRPGETGGEERAWAGGGDSGKVPKMVAAWRRIWRRDE
jgi:hypothetical protein